MLKYALAAVAAVAVSAPAFAGGLAPPTPEPVVVVPVAPVAQRSFDWTGFYAGVQVGIADLDAVDTAYTGSTGGGEDTLEGTAYGLHVGYMHDFGRFVVGGELRYDDASNVTSAGPNVDGDSMISARLKLGYDLGRVLPYVAVGGAQLTSTPMPLPSFDNKDTGLLYGVGVDFAVSDRWMVGADITHYEFDDFGGSAWDVSGNSIGLRASFRF